jgi:hypothetical protein
MQMTQLLNQIAQDKKKTLTEPNKLLDIAKQLYKVSKQYQEENYERLSYLNQASEYCGLFYNRVISVVTQDNSDQKQWNDWFQTLVTIRDNQIKALKKLEQYNQMKKYIVIGLDNCKVLKKRYMEEASLLDKVQQEEDKLKQQMEAVELELTERRYGDLKTNGSNVVVHFKNLDEGKVVLSQKDFKKGDIVFEEIPISSHVNITDFVDKKKIYCNHCLKVSINQSDMKEKLEIPVDSLMKEYTPKEFVECDHCHKEMYCCDTCKETAWKEYHELLCPRDFKHETEIHSYEILQRLSQVQNRTNPLLIARMLALVVQQVRTYSKDQKDSSVLLNIEDSFDIFQRFIFNEESHDRDTLAIQLIKEAIMMNLKDLSDSSKEIISEQLLNITIYRSLNGLILRNASTLYPITDFHLLLQTAAEKDPETVKPVLEQLLAQEKLTPEDELAATLDKTLQHSHKLRSLCVTGTGALTIHNCMNHSCDPNVVTVCGHPDHRVQVVALKEIKKGDEICISYIDEHVDIRTRRKALYSKYMFICHCARCNAETKA